MQCMFWKPRKSIAPPTQNHFSHGMKHVGMSQSATPATQNDITSCFETFNKERFGSFPHRHCDGTRKPATRDETCWSIKTGISCETSSNFTLRSVKIDVFLRVFFWTIPRNRHVTKCHHCQGICTLAPLRAALTIRFTENTRHDTSKVLRLPCKMTSEVFKVCTCHVKCNASFENVARVLAPATQNDFWQVVEHAGMSESATPATQNEAMRRWKAPKVTLLQNLPEAQHSDLARTIANGCERLRTVADGCGRLRTVANRCERLRNVWQTRSSTPTPSEWNGNPCYHSGKLDVHTPKDGIYRNLSVLIHSHSNICSGT